MFDYKCVAPEMDSFCYIIFHSVSKGWCVKPQAERMEGFIVRGKDPSVMQIKTNMTQESFHTADTVFDSIEAAQDACDERNALIATQREKLKIADE